MLTLRALGLTLASAAIVTTCGCARPDPTVTLATTTSMQDSGLLDVLVPMFRKQSGIDVKVVAVGTGQALELGRRGDADLVIVHDPAAEELFIGEGHGIERRPFAFDDFILVGPSADPAKVKATKSIVDAFRRISEHRAPFISRGDESGTHTKEKDIWRLSEIRPTGSWYVRAGAGMAQALRMASEKRAYTLSDRPTFLAQGKDLDLALMVEGDPLLVNQYSVMLVNPARHSHVHEREARKLADFLLAPATQRAVAEFGAKDFGQPLFFPGEASQRKR